VAPLRSNFGNGEPARSGGQRTMEKILSAAEEMFNRFGFEGARMDQIAERA